MQILRSAYVTGREPKHFHLDSNSPVRQQNATARSFSEPARVLLSKLCLHQLHTPSFPWGRTGRFLSAALSKQLPSKSHRDSHTSHVWVTATPLLYYSLPRSEGGNSLSRSNYARPENSEARHCQSVVFKYYESAPFPSPKSGGWLKKSHSLKKY